ncbi:MAG: hypothetical protein JW818_16505 [Pirellulales bacterium]|nr:hypothetical protein [Pirellulales bacterium]
MDENPYRSPQWCKEDLAWEARLARPEVKPVGPKEPKGVWRWGDMLVIRRDDHVFPQVCPFSLETNDLSSYLIRAIRPGALSSILLAVLMPGLGLFLAFVLLALLKQLRLLADVWLPLRFPIVAKCGLFDLATISLIVSGNVLTLFAMYSENYWLLAFGLLLPSLGFAVSMATSRWYIHAALLHPDYLAIHHVQPDYLALLPELPETLGDLLRQHL